LGDFCNTICQKRTKCAAAKNTAIRSPLVVGRIFNSAASPVGTPWMWTLAFGHHEDADAWLRDDARGGDGGVRAPRCRWPPSGMPRQRWRRKLIQIDHFCRLLRASEAFTVLISPIAFEPFDRPRRLITGNHPPAIEPELGMVEAGVSERSRGVTR